MIKRLALVFRGRFHKWVIVSCILTKDSWLLYMWLSRRLMSIETRVSCSIHDKKFRLQWPKLKLFLFMSNWWWGVGLIFTQITAQWSVNLFKVHCHSAWWSGTWIVALIVLHYVLVTIIRVRIKNRFNLGIVELALWLEILTYFLWVLNTVLIKRYLQVSFDRIFILVFVRDIIFIYIGCWVIVTVVLLLSSTINVVRGQLIVSFDYGLEISWL